MTSTSTAGDANSGGGGGGGGGNSTYYPKNGGSGVVIVKYPNTYSISDGAGLTYSTDSNTFVSYNVTTFTAGTGNVTFTL
jgi:hypothetical protein